MNQKSTWSASEPAEFASFLRSQVGEHVGEYGISRIGNLTELDLIGLPVWFATRPNAKSLSVSQGKGLSDDQAIIGAILESLEHHFAEQAYTKAEFIGTTSELKRRGLVSVPLDTMHRTNSRLLHASNEFSWLAGYSLPQNKPVYAPYELLGLDMTTKTNNWHDAFNMSSVGLGAAATIDEAVEHALLEVIENSGTSWIDFLGNAEVGCDLLQHSDICHPQLQDVLERVRAADCKVKLYGVKSTINLPTIMCVLDSATNELTRSRKLRHAGFASRICAYDAALAAVLEAVQSRLTDIAGARDDLTEHDYAEFDQQAESSQPGIVFSSYANRYDHPETDHNITNLDFILSKLNAIGINDVYVFPLGGKELGITVVRVLVSALEVCDGKQVYELSQHALGAFLDDFL